MKRNLCVSTLLWAKGLRWLRWLEEPCFENYVEMVAGLPRDTKMIKNFLINKPSLLTNVL